VVTEIENSCLNIVEKIDVLLVYSDQKPATLLLVSYQEDSIGGIHYLPQHHIEGIYELLSKVGLPFKAGEKYLQETIIHESVEWMPFYVAKKEENLMRLVLADETNDEQLLGKLFGYPDTAIQAYLGERPSFSGDLYDGSPLGFLNASFTHSKEFLEEEIRVPKRWHDTLCRLSPRLYSEIENFCRNTQIQSDEDC